LIENDLIFKTDQFTIRKLVGEAPFTSYFTNESPGRAAVWLGFRIVESFMNKNRGRDLELLMNNTNVQEILEKAKYDPQ
ncbi:MAG TPA: gliding motility protein GldB, partial [Bacteroidales bacterium]|nr:gliding motility protein GldB [Bacteroidales bacterium]HBZ19514.1 gliding motility protein GldB [Bacteroidales bacterium]